MDVGQLTGEGGIVTVSTKVEAFDPVQGTQCLPVDGIGYGKGYLADDPALRIRCRLGGRDSLVMTNSSRGKPLTAWLQASQAR